MAEPRLVAPGRRCGCSDGSDFPKQGRKSAGVARQYCGQAGEGGQLPGVRMFLAYVSPLGSGRWWTRGCICPRVGPHDQRPVCHRGGCAGGLGRNYRSKTELAQWRCWAGPPGVWATSTGAEMGRGGDDAFGMSPTFREGLAALGMRYVLDVPGPPLYGLAAWARLGPVRSIRGSAVPATQAASRGSAGPWSSAAVTSCRRRPGVRSRTVAPGKPGATQLPRSAPSGCGPTSRRKPGEDPVGRLLAPEPLGRQRIPLLPVQRSGGYSRWRPWPTWAGSRNMAHRNGVAQTEKGDVPGWTSTRPAAGQVAGITTPLAGCACWVPSVPAESCNRRIGGKSEMPRITRPDRSTGWCGKCCPGNSSGLEINCCAPVAPGGYAATVTNGLNRSHARKRRIHIRPRPAGITSHSHPIKLN